MKTTKKAIVIGTGAGGLMSAAYLAKYGFEVVALEKAPSIGGYLKSFSRKGYHFDPGIWLWSWLGYSLQPFTKAAVGSRLAAQFAVGRRDR